MAPFCSRHSIVPAGIDNQLAHELVGLRGGRPVRVAQGSYKRLRWRHPVYRPDRRASLVRAGRKILRLLEHREFVPVGASAPMPADLRVIAGTRHRLEAAVTRGAFRADLYFRLRALTVSLPPLHATDQRDAADP